MPPPSRLFAARFRFISAAAADYAFAFAAPPLLRFHFRITLSAIFSFLRCHAGAAVFAAHYAIFADIFADAADIAAAAIYFQRHAAFAIRYFRQLPGQLAFAAAADYATLPPLVFIPDAFIRCRRLASFRQLPYAFHAYCRRFAASCH
jgi:hypothetical protein